MYQKIVIVYILNILCNRAGNMKNKDRQLYLKENEMSFYRKMADVTEIETLNTSSINKNKSRNSLYDYIKDKFARLTNFIIPKSKQKEDNSEMATACSVKEPQDKLISSSSSSGGSNENSEESDNYYDPLPKYKNERSEGKNKQHNKSYSTDYDSSRKIGGKSARLKKGSRKSKNDRPLDKFKDESSSYSDNSSDSDSGFVRHTKVEVYEKDKTKDGDRKSKKHFGRDKHDSSDSNKYYERDEKSNTGIYSRNGNKMKDSRNKNTGNRRNTDIAVNFD